MASKKYIDFLNISALTESALEARLVGVDELSGRDANAPGKSRPAVLLSGRTARINVE